MKHLFTFVPIIVLIVCCNNGDREESTNTQYKQEMRSFVQGISSYAKNADSSFVVIPQNGQELVTADGNEDGMPYAEYLGAIDGVGREDLFFGYNRDNAATPESESEYMIAFLDICEEHGVEVLTTDYCHKEDKMNESYAKNEANSYISFAAPDRELNTIPSYPSAPNNENSNNILNLKDAKNFLYLINPEKFASKQEFINAINATNYDVIIIDVFFNETEFSSEEIEAMKHKKNGGSRLIVAYMSIGEAEDYRFYWQGSWKVGSPAWIDAENPDWDGNFKVKYWDPEWQTIIFGNEDAYLDKIMNAGFDGVYLDIIDAFEYFE